MKSNHWTRAFLTLLSGVPVFGLISCHHNPQASTAIDPWRLAPPFIQGSSAPNRPLMDTLNEPIDLESTLVFPSLASTEARSRSGASVELTVNASCAQGLVQSSTQQTLRNLSAIPMRSLIPSDLLRKVQAAPDARLICDFHFIAKNDIGSTHSFTVPRIEINGLMNLENWTIQMNDRRAGQASPDTTSEAPLTIQSEKLLNDDLDVPMELQAADGRLTAELECDQFSNFRTLTHSGSLSVEFESLVRGPIKNRDGNFISLRVDPRQISTQQTCRLVVTAFDPGSRLSRNWISKRFIVQYPVTGIQTKLDFHLGAIKMKTYQKAPFFTLAVHNQNPHPVAFRLPLDSANTFTLQVVHYYNKQKIVAAGNAFQERMTFTISNAFRSWNRDGFVYFEVAAQSSATIQARLNSNYHFLYYYENLSFKEIMQLAHPRAPIGWGFQLHPGFRLLRLRNWNSENPSFNGPAVDFTPLNLPNNEKGPVYSGWSPLTNWVKEKGAGRPKIGFKNVNMAGFGAVCKTQNIFAENIDQLCF